MAERPILFSGPMVRAILAGTKTQTRRVITPQPDRVWGSGVRHGETRFSAHVRYATGTPDVWVPCPYGAPGDRLWVRETWAAVSPDDEFRPIRECNIEYRADTDAARPGGWDADDDDPAAGRWRPSIHMPRWASRLTIEVLSVRVERVQDISEADAQAEGVELPAWDNASYRVDFARLWDSINDARGYGWKVNPWVWVVEFKRVQP